ncbi:MAG: hypothetical protein E7260_00765 [Lachnospiraceae bacterium]|nr:hypothetical protein [Lachnospiraceae bacterium]
MIDKLLQEYGIKDKDENGLYVSDTMPQEKLLSEILPKFAKIKTETDRNYNELVLQCRQAVISYPDSELIFVMLAEVLEQMSEQIFEHYQTVRTLLWKQYPAVADKKSDMVYYALAKGCFYKAFLAEKYEDAFVTVLTGKEKYPKAYQEVLRLSGQFGSIIQGEKGRIIWTK